MKKVNNPLRIVSQKTYYFVARKLKEMCNKMEFVYYGLFIVTTSCIIFSNGKSTVLLEYIRERKGFCVQSLKQYYFNLQPIK